METVGNEATQSLCLQDIQKRSKRRKSFNKCIRLKEAWYSIKSEWILWILLLVAILIPIISVAASFDECDFFVIMNNVCYSYIAGIVFYFFADFKPRVKNKANAKQMLAKTYRSTYTNYVIVAEALGIIDANGGLLSNYQSIADKQLVITNSTSFQPGIIQLNPLIMPRLSAMKNLIKSDIERQLLLTSNVLDEVELSDLHELSDVFNRLFLSDLPQAGNSFIWMAKECDVEYFINSFTLEYGKVKRLSTEYHQYTYHEV